jgi:putative ABC transport system substrate-binding protein
MRTIAFGALVVLGVLASGMAGAEPKTVAITAIVEHPALDAVRDGVMKGLADAGTRRERT